MILTPSLALTLTQTRLLPHACVMLRNRTINFNSNDIQLHHQLMPCSVFAPFALARVETFKQFMETFAEVCIQSDHRIYLTIVYFGTEDQAEILTILKHVASTHNYTDYKFIAKDNEEFSRGVGLFTGAEAWEKGNVLMFFCDVDIYFDQGFLNRCRMNAEPGRKVYYPMVFSLYNPEIVYRGKELPSWHDQLVIGKNTGYWRDFGFGMTCVYRSDFLYMKGFDTSIKGWGAEDVKLYKKIVASNLEVVRAPDRGEDACTGSTLVKCVS